MRWLELAAAVGTLSHACYWGMLAVFSVLMMVNGDTPVSELSMIKARHESLMLLYLVIVLLCRMAEREER